MLEDNSDIRKRHFAANWLAWSALHHFLSAPLLRELSYVIIDRITNGTLSFNQLFDEVSPEGDASFASWLIRPLEPATPLATYLQYRIRAFAWQSDASGFSTSDFAHFPDDVSPSTLERVIEFGVSDFTTRHLAFSADDSLGQTSIDHFIQAFMTTRSAFGTSPTKDFIASIETALQPVEMPLRAVISKHLGDLCANRDEWDKAKCFYELANQKFASCDNLAWSGFNETLKAIITQSLAAAILNLQGVKESAELLNRALIGEQLENARILHGNASFDAFVATSQANLYNLPTDLRATVLLPPLLHKTHHAAAAMGNWLDGKFSDANKRYWAVLRRQIALGSAVESRSTKSFFARSIFEEIDQSGARQGAQQSFNMATRLLVESGNRKAVSKIRWTERLIAAYVDQSCVDSVIRHAEIHAGVKIERQLVIIELFREWTEKLPSEPNAVAFSMLRHIATLAMEPSSLSLDQNIGGYSLEALLALSKKRPELRQAITSEVVAVIAFHLQPASFWRGCEDALKLAYEYLEVFDGIQLESVIELILSFLTETSPEAGVWPIVRPALHLLVSKQVRYFVKNRPDLGQRIIAIILQFGVEQESENARVLFYLHDFDQTLLVDPSIREALQETVSKVRQKAAGINSSNVVEQIQALLLAPAVSGIDGVKDALNGVTLILRSATETRPSIALSYAYDPLLLLARNHQRIASALNMSAESFQDELKPIFPLIIDLWNEAIESPLVLAPFSFPPPTSLDQIVVHNWAFASMRFAELLQEGGRLEEVFAAAAAQPMLANGIALARATQAVAGPNDNFDAEAIRVENRETFYSILGRRLVVLQRLTPEQGSNLCEALTEQCLKHGPCEIDAAVFLGAIRLNLCDRFSCKSYSNYMKRLENKRDLRLTLMPILQMMKRDEEVDDDE